MALDRHVRVRLQICEAEAPHGFEVGSVPGRQTKSVFDRSCRNEGVVETDTALSTDSAGAFRHGAIDWDLPEWCKECADQILRRCYRRRARLG
jgi:hypothetical protein